MATSTQDLVRARLVNIAVRNLRALSLRALSLRALNLRAVSLRALSLRAGKRSSPGVTPPPRTLRPVSLQREPRCLMRPVTACASSPSAREAAAFRPTCRLRLEGRNAQEGACDILELSAEGVTIALHPDRAARSGQQGQLLIGPADGAHYTLPVAVRWVKASPTASVVGLAFPATERWTYSHS